MRYGIVENSDCRKLFDKINQGYTTCDTCKTCRENRKQFANKDKKYLYDKKNHNHNFSNFLPGFSSKEIEIPIDILIIADSHGGGRKETFYYPQKSLIEEVHSLADYYLNKQDKTFHQYCIKELLNELNNKNKSWVFTDLIKCFVWHGHDKLNKDIKGSKNREIAITYCKNYLEEQIDLLNPKKIIALGKTVQNELKKLKHNALIIDAIFPSGFTADRWIKNERWENVLKVI